MRDGGEEKKTAESPQALASQERSMERRTRSSVGAPQIKIMNYLLRTPYSVRQYLVDFSGKYSLVYLQHGPSSNNMSRNDNIRHAGWIPAHINLLNRPEGGGKSRDFGAGWIGHGPIRHGGSYNLPKGPTEMVGLNTIRLWQYMTWHDIMFRGHRPGWDLTASRLSCGEWYTVEVWHEIHCSPISPSWFTGYRWFTLLSAIFSFIMSEPLPM